MPANIVQIQAAAKPFGISLFYLLAIRVFCGSRSGDPTDLTVDPPLVGYLEGKLKSQPTLSEKNNTGTHLPYLKRRILNCIKIEKGPVWR